MKCTCNIKRIDPRQIAQQREATDAEKMNAAMYPHYIDKCPLCKAAPEMLGILLKLEWLWSYNPGWDLMCPICENMVITGNKQHKDDCKLKALIAKAKGGPS